MRSEEAAGAGGIEVTKADFEVEAAQAGGIEFGREVGRAEEEALKVFQAGEELVYLRNFPTAVGASAVAQKRIHFVNHEDGAVLLGGAEGLCEEGLGLAKVGAEEIGGTLDVEGGTALFGEPAGKGRLARAGRAVEQAATSGHVVEPGNELVEGRIGVEVGVVEAEGRGAGRGRGYARTLVTLGAQGALDEAGEGLLALASLSMKVGGHGLRPGDDGGCDPLVRSDPAQERGRERVRTNPAVEALALAGRWRRDLGYDVEAADKGGVEATMRIGYPQHRHGIRFQHPVHPRLALIGEAAAEQAFAPEDIFALIEEQEGAAIPQKGLGQAEIFEALDGGQRITRSILSGDLKEGEVAATVQAPAPSRFFPSPEDRRANSWPPPVPRERPGGGSGRGHQSGSPCGGNSADAAGPWWTGWRLLAAKHRR